jgi:hypothetical protein
MRSPPPPVPQGAQNTQPQQQNYGYGGAGFIQPPFGGFINENTASMGVQMAEKYVVNPNEKLVDSVSWSRHEQQC